MRELGKRILDMAKPLRDTLTIIVIMATLRWVRLMERVFTLGQMEKSMMENGCRDSNKVTVFGEDYTTIHTLANGLNLKLTGMEFTPGKMVIVMKVSGTCA